MKIDPDDPILTAYALGELDEDARVAVKARLENSPKARRSVEEIVQTADLLARELASEPVACMNPRQRELIEAAAELVPSNVVRVPFWHRHFVRWSVAAAACVALAFILLPLHFSKIKSSPPNALAANSAAALRSATERLPAQSKTVNSGQDSGLSAPAATVAYLDEPQANAPVTAPVSVEPTPAARHGLLRPGIQTPSGPVSMDRVLAARYELARQGTQATAQPVQITSSPGAGGASAKGVNTLGESDPTAVTASLSSRSVQPRGMAPEMMRRYGLRPPSPALASKDGAGVKLVEEQRESPRSDRDHRDETPTRGNTASYPAYVENPFRSVVDQPLSTFSIDVDTASYANVRRFLNQGQWPPRDAVRIEELINYFTYDYSQPRGDHPFSVQIDVAGCPWNTGHRLVRVGLKGRDIAHGKRPPGNFVFLIDVSGSMAPPERLPLIKQALRQLVGKMTATDRVAIVVYASSSGTVLSSTACAEKEKIFAAIDRLAAGGSTNGGEGIQQAYAVASENFIQGGVNRVVLCTDGDFNVGITDQDQLLRLIQQKAKNGVFLTTLGVGTENYKDALMQQLADKGNGNYHYLDTLEEAQKVLIQQLNANLVTIAKDVKIQIEFNPAQVSSYRLIGYEKRVLRNQDFHNDRKDAGEIGAGHTVTAFYEIVPEGTRFVSPVIGEKLKYQPNRAVSVHPSGGPVASPDPEEQLIRARGDRMPKALGTKSSPELLTLTLRYKQPDATESQLLEFTASDGGAGFSRASTDFKFAAAVAEFGMVLKNSEFKGGATLDSVLEIAQETKGADVGGYRSEFVNLVRRAQTLTPRTMWPTPARDSDQNQGFE